MQMCSCFLKIKIVITKTHSNHQEYERKQNKNFQKKRNTKK